MLDTVTSFPTQRRKAKAVDAPAAWLDLVSAIGNLKPHTIVGRADAADFRERNENMMLIAAAVDKYIHANGAELCSHSHSGGFEMKWFVGPVTDALQGCATHVLESEAEYLEHGGRA